MMRINLCLVWATVLTLNVLPMALAQGEKNMQTEARARELLEMITSGQCADFVANGTETIQSGITAEQLQTIWAAMQLQLGQYHSILSAEPTQNGEMLSVRFMLKFAKGRQPIRLVVDKAGKAAGLWFDAPEAEVAYTPPVYVKQDSFTEEDVTVSAGQFPLGATLTIPKTPGPHPGVVLVHGSGPHDRDETVGGFKVFRDIAWGLASRGIVVLRYEKRTKAHPAAVDRDEWNLDNEVVEDALAAAKLLRERKEVDPRGVFIAGHSLGGLAAPYIAQRDDKLAGIIVLAGSARPLMDLVVEQSEYLARLDGDLSADEQEKLDTLRKACTSMRAGKLDEAPPIGLPIKYFAKIDKLRPAEVAEKLTLPMLILQGGRDYQVTADDFALWRKHLGSHKNVEFRLFDTLTHLFSPGTTPPTPADYQKPGHVDGEVISVMANWIEHMPPAKR